MSSEVPYFISLGAGLNQIPLIEAAKDMGYEVIAIDPDLDAPGFELADIRIQEMMMNYRKIHYKIGMTVFEDQIAGGYCASYGEALLAWSFLIERLNLHGLSRTYTEALIDKLNVRRSLMGGVLFHQPDFLNIEGNLHKEELDAMGYPLIIKTRRGAGKKNIFLATDYFKVKKHLNQQNLKAMNIDPSEILIEEFVEGDEIIVVGIVQDFKFNLISITDKTTSMNPPFIDLEHKFPSSYYNKMQEIIKIHQEIVDRFQIPSTPLVSEFKIQDGRFYLIEISPQIPGEFLATFLIPEALRYNYYQNLVRMATNTPILPVKLPRNPRKLKPVSLQFIERPISGEQWRKKSASAKIALVLNKKPNFPPKDNSDRFGVMGF